MEMEMEMEMGEGCAPLIGLTENYQSSSLTLVTCQYM